MNVCVVSVAVNVDINTKIMPIQRLPSSDHLNATKMCSKCSLFLVYLSALSLQLLSDYAIRELRPNMSIGRRGHSWTWTHLQTDWRISMISLKDYL